MKQFPNNMFSFPNKCITPRDKTGYPIGWQMEVGNKDAFRKGGYDIFDIIDDLLAENVKYPEKEVDFVSVDNLFPDSKSNKWG